MSEAPDMGTEFESGFRVFGEAGQARMRATRRLDQLRQAQAETVGLSVGGRPRTGFSDNPLLMTETPIEKPPTLREAGIDKKLSSRVGCLTGRA